MHSSVAAGGLAAILVLAGTAFSLVAPAHDDGHADPLRPMDHAGSGRMNHAAGAHPWTGGTGQIPASPDITTSTDRRDRIVIPDDASFNPSNGVRSGTGTFEDPFIISDWIVDSIYIHDTTAAFVIRENFVRDILVLDWTGQGGYVHHNNIANLRTNRNVERVGDPSATVIEHNLIARVEELRHFDGIVRNNTIGRAPVAGLIDLDNSVALNIAGLNGAGIHDNRIFGGVDMKIHGHHHSDATGAHSHNHGQPDAAQGEDHVEDHQTRYVDFLFYNNTISDTGFGMRYNDLNHAGDDRTATSEQEPELEKPHIHHTRVTLRDNVIDGATLRVAVLNSADERHVAGQTATLVLESNRILRPTAGDGIVVQDVADALVIIRGNVVERARSTCEDPADIQACSADIAAGRIALPVGGVSGILLQRFSNSSVEVEDNILGDYKYGIRASRFDALTTWRVGVNDAGRSEHPVYWDNTVPNAPEGSGAPATAAHEHDHEHDHSGGAQADTGYSDAVATPASLRLFDA